ncbi:MAG: hypothetical protein ACK4IX_14370 [Candidatus Sericytochromatia bacterium]
MFDVKNEEVEEDLSNQNLEVYCAWCKTFLYIHVNLTKENFKASHGICKECAYSNFGITD